MQYNCYTINQWISVKYSNRTVTPCNVCKNPFDHVYIMSHSYTQTARKYFWTICRQFSLGWILSMSGDYCRPWSIYHTDIVMCNACVVLGFIIIVCVCVCVRVLTSGTCITSYFSSWSFQYKVYILLKINFTDCQIPLVIFDPFEIFLLN